MSETATNIKLASASQSKQNYNALASPSTATVTINKYDLCIYRAKTSSKTGLKKKNVKIEIPRAVLETRSPGSKPKILLEQLEAVEKKRKAKRKIPRCINTATEIQGIEKIAKQRNALISSIGHKKTQRRRQ